MFLASEENHMTTSSGLESQANDRMTSIGRGSQAHESIVVTPEAMGAAGAVSYWRASGSIQIAALTAAWARAGLDPKLLRNAPEPETALRRAVLELATREHVSDKVERRILVRPQQEPSTWAVVEEIVAEGVPPAYTTLEIISFVEGTGPQFYTVSGTQDQAARILAAVMANFTAQQGLFAPEDITGWLVKLAYKFGALALRDSGGVYFIPRPAMETWNKIATVIEAMSAHKIFRIPAMKNSEAVEAIIDAVTAEAEQVAKAIEEEVVAGLGARALTTRKSAIDALLAKVSSYEELVGQQIKVRDRVEALSAAVAEARLAATVQEEAA
jgi:hypothetical protein